MPDLSRRAFLGSVVTVAAAAALPTGWAAPALAGTGPAGFASGQRQFSRARFAAHLGRRFHMVAMGPRGRVATTVVLTDIADTRSRGAAGGGESFTLLFRARAGGPSIQGLHTFRRRGFGTVDLFVVPVDRGVSHQFYQAVISRPSHRSVQKQGARSVRTVSR